jgi:general secretion pathway protein B
MPAWWSRVWVTSNAETQNSTCHWPQPAVTPPLIHSIAPMSYILEALRRSQAERERGQVPGLHAQPTLGAPGPPQRRRLDPMALVVAAAALLLAAVLLAWWLRRDGAAPAAATTGPADLALRPPQPTGALTTSVVPPTPQPMPTPAQQAPLPMVVSAPAPAPAPAPAFTPTPAPVVAVAVAAANKPNLAQPLAPLPKSSASAPSLTVLGAEQRRDLPPLVVGGSVFSDTPASRFVIVNGQLVREGESAAPGVLVERIGPKALVLRWRDLRFEWPL